MDIFGPNFGPIPAQSKLANFGSILLCDTANMVFLGGKFIFDTLGSLWARFVSVSVPKNGSILAQFLPKLNNPFPVRFCSVIRLIRGFYGWGIHLTLLDHFGHFLYPIRAQKWLNFGPIPAQAK